MNPKWKTVWRKIEGFPEYKVSDNGIVKHGDKNLKYHTGRYHRVTLYRGSVSTAFLVQRLVAGAFIESIDGKDQVDHINGDRYDNRISNLRWTTSQEQKWNTPCSGYSKHRGKYHSTIRDNSGNKLYIGSYDTPEEAQAAYVKRAVELRGVEFTPRLKPII